MLRTGAIEFIDEKTAMVHQVIFEVAVLAKLYNDKQFAYVKRKNRMSSDFKNPI